LVSFVLDHQYIEVVDYFTIDKCFGSGIVNPNIDSIQYPQLYIFVVFSEYFEMSHEDIQFDHPFR